MGGGMEMGGGMPGMMGGMAGGMGGGTPGMGGGMAGGMGGAAPAGGDQPPIPNGIIRGVAPQGHVFVQLTDYGHINQMGRRVGHAMVHVPYVGRDDMPKRWAELRYTSGKKPEDFDPFLMQLKKVYSIDQLARSAHDEYQRFIAKESDPDFRPQVQYVLDLAVVYTALPAPAMSEYMLARAEKIMADGWKPNAERIKEVVNEIARQQAKGPQYSGGDLMPNLVNYLKEDPDAELALGAWMSSPSPEVWLATLSILHREGSLPVIYEPQYLSTNRITQDALAGGVALASTTPLGTGSEFGRGVPTYFQQDPKQLSVEQLQTVRRSMIQAIESGAQGVMARVAWSRLFLVEMELRDRTSARGVNASWREIMSLWRRRDETVGSGGYADTVLAAATKAAKLEIRALRAANIVDIDIQRALRENKDLALPGSVDQLAELREYVKKRPAGRSADHARYMLGIVLAASMDDPAGDEQLSVLKDLQAPPEWWRWGLEGWESFKMRSRRG